jgi:hypothetical protein
MSSVTCNFFEPRLLSVCGRRVVFLRDEDSSLYSLSRSFAFNDPCSIHRDTHRQYLFNTATTTGLLAEETANAANTSDLAPPKSRKRGSGTYPYEIAANAASEAAAAAAALANAPPPTALSFSETHDLSTTLPLFNFQLPLPLPHTEASQQRIQLPQSCATSLEDILPQKSTSSVGITPHIFDLSRAHISYFQNLKAWFYGVHQQRRQRYKNRLAILGMQGGVDESIIRGSLRDSPRGLAAMAGLSASPTSMAAIDSLCNPVNDTRNVDALAMLELLGSSASASQEPEKKRIKC